MDTRVVFRQQSAGGGVFEGREGRFWRIVDGCVKSKAGGAPQNGVCEGWIALPRHRGSRVPIFSLLSKQFPQWNNSFPPHVVGLR